MAFCVLAAFSFASPVTIGPPTTCARESRWLYRSFPDLIIGAVSSSRIRRSSYVSGSEMRISGPEEMLDSVSRLPRRLKIVGALTLEQRHDVEQHDLEWRGISALVHQGLSMEKNSQRKMLWGPLHWSTARRAGSPRLAVRPERTRRKSRGIARES